MPILNSFFLFGARGTGKSTLIQERFSAQTTYLCDLLDRSTEDLVKHDLGYFRRTVEALPESITHVIIDEVQVAPELLNDVHWLIENSKIKRCFILTGSSARKLRAGAANLLAGRAFVRNLFPISFQEAQEVFNLEKALKWGMLPKIFSFTTEEEKRDFLMSYTHTYLKEEVISEQLVRKVGTFRKFLELAGEASGKIINSKKIADQISTSGKTIQVFFQILEDTLLGFTLDAFHTSLRARVRMAPKFYLFDVGVARAFARMLSVEPHMGTSYGGELFEQFLVVEFFKISNYRKNDYKFSYLRTKGDLEIDLVIERPGKTIALVEIKSTNSISERDFSTLASLFPSFENAEAFLVSRDNTEQVFKNIRAMPWQKALDLI